ncbi:biotin carboxylase N-terminal domain-containing protein [Brevibacterium salitolerans]|uniref:ATP-binding protein n=1 Tax=Brevibacterium salitolerans TaxID=1403566 RepID=UPI0031DE253B
MTAQPSPLTRVLVANRGEIARRVFATCRARGIGTVAVFSDADADAAFVSEADSAVRLPGTSPADTYLRGDLVVEAALSAGADAVHPGYGFLSENADFARAVLAAGLTWIGPTPESIEQMGSKVESKRLMAEAGVPVLTELEPEVITEADLPVLVKASAGGGGRGMRVVERLADLRETVESASREAASAFGDATVFCERYIPEGHHIEVQVFGDSHGRVWAVGERECSVQRRHQKVVEEAPAPLVERHGSAMRARLYEAARSAAERIGYVGAGTVEFLAADDGSFYFLEMNTRLQVEHPVTECTTGMDLVGLQLDIAAGGALTGEEPESSGHAIEVRLYAEDPDEDWQPQSGPVHAFAVPGADVAFAVPGAGGVQGSGPQGVGRQSSGLQGPALRLDAGLEAGETITTFYDPMIAKVIGVGPTRQAAAHVLASGLESMRWDGPRTNADLLAAVLREPGFLAGETTTRYFEDHPEVFGSGADETAVAAAAVAAAVASGAAAAAGAVAGPGDVLVSTAGTGAVSGEEALALAIAQDHPRPAVGGWRLFHADWRSRTFTVDGEEITVEYRQRRDAWEVNPESLPAGADIRVVAAAPGSVRLSVDGVERRYAVSRRGRSVMVSSPAGALRLEEAPRYTDPSAVAAPGSLLAPMPGTVLRVGAEVGQTVSAGQPIVWLEAMKMEHTISSDADGVLVELRVSAGDQVDVGTMLAVIEDPDAEGVHAEGAGTAGSAGAAGSADGADATRGGRS